MQCDRKPATIVHYHRNEKDPLSPPSNTAECPLFQHRSLEPRQSQIITEMACYAISHDRHPYQGTLPAAEELVSQEKKVHSVEGMTNSAGPL